MKMIRSLLVYYKSSQTYTNTVYEHISAFGLFSENRIFYSCLDSPSAIELNLNNFDAVIIHYSVRVAYDQLPVSVTDELAQYNGLKILFLQDEYDNTNRARFWINRLGFQLVFTCVPSTQIPLIYPQGAFPSTKFVNNLTGYIASCDLNEKPLLPPSQRELVIGYRGRPLPLRYGQLGFEKVLVGKITKEYCLSHGIPCDIEWSEKSRIYGPNWNIFLVNCKGMLGSESGSNVFNWDGTLDAKIADYRRINPKANESTIYEEVVKPVEIDGIMNQISPRVFEAVSARTVLVLFEGSYSGIIEPNVHYIPLKKDGSNLREVFEMLYDNTYVDTMAERAYKDLVQSGKFSYEMFIEEVDSLIESAFLTHQSLVTERKNINQKIVAKDQALITTMPLRFKDTGIFNFDWQSLDLIVSLGKVWVRIPNKIRDLIHPLLGRVKRAIIT